MRPTGTEETLYQEAVLTGCMEIRKDGSVWRIAQRRMSRWDGTVTIRPVNPKRIDASVGVGYRTVKMMVCGKQTTALAHRLVWRVLRGPIPPGLTINHYNGKKWDNRPENLELATYSEQMRHAVHVIKTARTANQGGEKNHHAKLRVKAVREIRRRRRAGERLKSIALDFGVTDRQVSKIARFKAWSSIK